MHRGSWQRRTLAIALAIGIALWVRYCDERLTPVADADSETTPRTTEATTVDPARLATGRERIARAFAAHESGVWVEADGEVERLLRDDDEGSRHQKFIVDLGELTVLISHNIDLAPRVPVQPGERVVFRGRYEWNPQGGVVHWTHHDPRGRGPGGWITVGGRTYR